MKLRFKNVIFIVLSIILALSIFVNPAVGGVNENEEIERKFLLDVSEIQKNFPAKVSVFTIVQTYICFSPEMRVRLVNDLVCYFTLKRPKDDIGLSREEIEFQITPEEYSDLLAKKVGSTIYKTRYQFYQNGIYIAVDVYSKDLSGLAVAEVEFESVKEANAFKPPAWFGKDVTSDSRYKNANLARYGMPSPK